MGAPKFGSREKADALYAAVLTAIEAGGSCPFFRRDVLEECGKAFERFLEKHCLSEPDGEE